MLNGVRLGPLTIDEVCRMPLTPDTPVWRQGMPQWQAASSFPELASAISYSSQPSMPPIPPINRAVPPVPVVETTQEPMPPTFLAWSIVVLVLCCVPTGIVALINSCRVTSRFNRGDVAGARNASSLAELWVMISIVSGLVGLPFSICLTMLG